MKQPELPLDCPYLHESKMSGNGKPSGWQVVALVGTLLTGSLAAAMYVRASNDHDEVITLQVQYKVIIDRLDKIDRKLDK